MELKEKRQQYDVGVIVGRFQVPELHDAHTALVEHVCREHDKVIIFLGMSPLMVTTENPLDFESRKQMLLEQFPQVTVLYVRDMWSDIHWSRNLDQQIEDLTSPSQTVVLYGGRDSFINHYEGKHDTRELEQDTYIRFSGTEFRKKIASSSVRSSADFRAGVVWAAHSTFPTVYTCVDVAIFNRLGTKILLGRKGPETKYRLIGGFADPGSSSFEDDARREVREETGIEISEPAYRHSFNIDDWRYRGERDCIRTLLFSATHMSGDPEPGDDIAEVRWFPLAELAVDEMVMPNHVRLVKTALNYINCIA